MYVLLLTAFVSLVLVALFLALFVRERTGGRSISSSERDALLPFDRGEAKERPRRGDQESR